MIASGAALVSLFASSAFAQVSPPPDDKVTVQVVTLNGSGCGKDAKGNDTAVIAVSPDNTAFTVTYSNYLAQAGAGTKVTDNRRNCQINVAVNVPQGFSYAIAEVDYRGFAALEPGAFAVEQANYYFQGSPLTGTIQHVLHPDPITGNWQESDSTGFAALIWSPCGERKNLNVNTALIVKQGSADPTTTSYATMDSTDGSIKTVYHFAWRTCQ
jgi:hypothetical protein